MKEFLCQLNCIPQQENRELRTDCALLNFPCLIIILVSWSTTGSYRRLKWSILLHCVISGRGNLWPRPASGYSNPTAWVSIKLTLASSAGLRAVVEYDLFPEEFPALLLSLIACFSTSGALSNASLSRLRIYVETQVSVECGTVSRARGLTHLFHGGALLNIRWRLSHRLIQGSLFLAHMR